MMNITLQRVASVPSALSAALVVAVLSAAASAQPAFLPVDIFTNASGAFSVFAADIDGDGDTDVLSASQLDNAIRWYENDGNQIFTARDISTSASGARSVFAADVDGDGETDVLSASLGDDAIRWYENDANGSTVRNTTTGVISPTIPIAISLASAGDRLVADAVRFEGDLSIDFDGKALELLGIGPINQPVGGRITLANNALLGYAERTLELGAAEILLAAGDQEALFAGTLDIPAGDRADLETQTLIVEPTGSIELGASSALVAGSLENADILGNLGLSAGSAFVFPGDLTLRVVPGFSTNDISTSADGARSVFAADVDGDGDTDVLSASFFDNAIRWYENDGNQNFTARDISTTAGGAVIVFAADVDGDGDTDVLSASLIDDSIRWYENDADLLPPVQLSSGALLTAGGSIANSRVLELNGGTIVAGGGFTNSGALTGRGEIIANTINAGSVVLVADTINEGDYTNDGTTTIQSGTLTVLGTLTDNGTIIGDFSGSARASDGMFVQSAYTAGAGATLRFPQGGTVAVGGNYDNAIDSNTRFDLASARLTLNSIDGTQSLETMSVDIGDDLAGLDRTIAGHYPLGTLRIGPTATTVNLIDAHDNAGDGQASCEAVYVSDLIIETGATLNTNGCTVYYETLALDGAVDDPINLVPLEAVTICTGDCDDSGTVDFNDLVSMLFEFGNTGDLRCNADGIGTVNFNDLVSALFLFGPCP